jgi:hypothetical protein
MFVYSFLFIVFGHFERRSFSSFEGKVSCGFRLKNGILKLTRSLKTDSKESIPPAYVACARICCRGNLAFKKIYKFVLWRAGTTTLFLLGS